MACLAAWESGVGRVGPADGPWAHSADRSATALRRRRDRYALGVEMWRSRAVGARGRRSHSVDSGRRQQRQGPRDAQPLSRRRRATRQGLDDAQPVSRFQSAIWTGTSRCTTTQLTRSAAPGGASPLAGTQPTPVGGLSRISLIRIEPLSSRVGGLRWYLAKVAATATSPRATTQAAPVRDPDSDLAMRNQSAGADRRSRRESAGSDRNSPWPTVGQRGCGGGRSLPFVCVRPGPHALVISIWVFT